MPLEKIGHLVIVDGPSGSGKDTLCLSLVHFTSAFLFQEETADPQRADIAAAKDDDLLMAQLLISHRRLLYQQFVTPQLQSGHLVITNRGEPATLAYQTRRNQLSLDQVWDLHRQAEIPLPHAVAITSCTPQTALERTQTDTSSTRKHLEKSSGLSGKISFDPTDSSAQKLVKAQLIHNQYLKVASFLTAKGVTTFVVDTENHDPHQAAHATLNFLKSQGITE